MVSDAVGEAVVGAEDVGEATVGVKGEMVYVGEDAVGAGFVLPGATVVQYLLLSLRAAPHERPEQHGVALQTELTWPHCCPEATGAGVGAGVAPGAPELSNHSHLLPQLPGPVSMRRTNHE